MAATHVRGASVSSTYSEATDPAACAQVDLSQSNAWLDGASQQNNFMVRVTVRPEYWRPDVLVFLEWSSQVSIDNIFQATQSQSYDTDGRHVTVALTSASGIMPLPNTPLPAFSLMGHGSLDMPLRLHCTNKTMAARDDASTALTQASAGNPSYADASDCDLGAEFLVTNPYPQLSDVKVRLNEWQAGRIVTLRFTNQDLAAINIMHATLEDSLMDGDDKVMLFKLDATSASQICNTGHVINGVYVRDTNCGGDGSEKQHFTFQLQPGPSDPPRILCSVGPPPPPPDYSSDFPTINPGYVAPTPIARAPPMYAMRRSPPPSPPSPPPPMPLVEVMDCAAGGVGAVERLTRDGEMTSLQISVRPSYLWPTGFDYVVGLRGLQLQVSGAAGASMASPDLRHLNDPEALHEYLFHPVPSSSKFQFHVRGIDARLVSVTCRLELPSPSPPRMSPQPPSAPPPLLAKLSKITGFQFSHGLRSFASRSAVGVLAVLACISVLLRLRSAFCAGAGKHRHGTRLVHGGETEMDDVGNSVGDEANDWMVELQLSGQSIDMPLPHSVATSPSELKQALGELAVEVLGPGALPTDWLADDYTSMRVIYRDASDQPAVMRPSTCFRQVCRSPTLRVVDDSQQYHKR